jgi:flagellar hook-associated protein 3 FlgL
MRITVKMIAENAVKGVQYNAEKIGTLRKHISFARRVMTPSDDPVATGTALNVRGEMNAISHYKLNADRATNWLRASDTALNDIFDSLQEARTLTVRMLNDSTDTTPGGAVMRGAAETIEGLVQRSLQAANTTYQNEYLFSGAATKTRPFAEGDAIDTGTAPPTTSKRVYYVADARPDPEQAADGYKLRVAIAPNTRVAMSINGATLAPKAAGIPPSADFSAPTAFNVLTNLRSDFAAPSLDKNVLRTRLDELDEAINSVLGAQAQVGSSLNRIGGVQEQLSAVDLNLKEVWSRTVDLDMSEAITQLNIQERVYETSLAAAGRTTNLKSLMDFLQ